MSAVRSRVAAHLSSWVESPKRLCFVAVRHCQGLLEGVGLDVPFVEEFGRHTSSVGPRSRHGSTGLPDVWKNDTSGDRCGPSCQDPARALVRSQQGLLASAAQTALPTSRATRIETIPGVVVQAPLSPAPIVLSHLPMWPPTRHVWPPSCSVFEGWGVGLQRFSRGAGGCSSLSGGRRTCGSGQVHP